MSKSKLGGTMKFKVFSGVLIFIVLFAFLTMGHPLKYFERDTEGYNPEDSDPVVKLKPNEFSDAGKKEVMKQIERIQKTLEHFSSKGKLNKERIEKIAKFYREPGVFTKHDGETLLGGDDIAKYFFKERDNIENIEFKLEYVFAEELTHILNNPSEIKPEKDIVQALYLVISCSFEYKGVRIDPPNSTNQKHMRSCEWD